MYFIRLKKIVEGVDKSTDHPFMTGTSKQSPVSHCLVHKIIISCSSFVVYSGEKGAKTVVNYNRVKNNGKSNNFMVAGKFVVFSDKYYNQ